jgi:hypothetical protein
VPAAYHWSNSRPSQSQKIVVVHFKAQLHFWARNYSIELHPPQPYLFSLSAQTHVADLKLTLAICYSTEKLEESLETDSTNMKLINTSTLELHDFYLADIPPYAILSHTWSDGEVNFQEMSSKNCSSKKGFAKIARTCQIALADGLEYAWVDTCCIDKSSSAELSEAINSMYQWYAKAAFCYVFLEDLPSDGTWDLAEKALPTCRWFTRGWTLQELLAPRIASNVRFYDKKFFYRGSKVEFVNAISKCTGVPRDVLMGVDAIAKYSVASKMSWAARRKTTRLEDSAYCLLGIFDVNMPLLYGEGGKAFRRLQEEIIKRHNDLTIFSWKTSRLPNTRVLGLFAESPEAFIHSSLSVPFSFDFVDFSVTNKGLRISGDLPLHVVYTKRQPRREGYQYAVFISYTPNVADGMIFLRKLGPKIFYRALLPEGTSSFAGRGDTAFSETDAVEDTSEYYILIDQNQKFSSKAFLNGALHIPPISKYDGFELQLRDAIPQTLWDVTNTVFLKPRPGDEVRYPLVIAATFGGMVDHQFLELVLLCDYRSDVGSPICRIFFKGSYPRVVEMLFQGRNRNESIYWSQFQFDCPEILQLGNTIEISRKERRRVVISAWFERKKVNVAMITHREDVEMFSLRIDFTVKDNAVRVFDPLGDQV